MKASVYFRSSRRRHPLLRVALAVVAVGLLAFASVFVLLLAGAILGAWLLRRGWQRLRGAPQAGPSSTGNVLDAEYRVVSSENSRLVSR